MRISANDMNTYTEATQGVSQPKSLYLAVSFPIGFKIFPASAVCYNAGYYIIPANGYPIYNAETGYHDRFHIATYYESGAYNITTIHIGK